jgi:N-acetylated-alpha-linked acidic dipeptidase
MRATLGLFVTLSFLLPLSGCARPLADLAYAEPLHQPAGESPSTEKDIEARFLAVPDPKLAEEHLRILTQAPHLAGTPEDKATADYVAQKFREAGLETEIVEYKVWINYPSEISVDLTYPPSARMHGPNPEYVAGDPYDKDPRIVIAFNGESPSGDVEAEVVYANYGTADDFQQLESMHTDLHGKILLIRYGQNFRGVKVLLAQRAGAAGVILYSDPADDGWARGDKYPDGPWRPATGVQRGSVGFMFEFAGDPTTPGFASVPSLPDAKRIPPEQSAALPKIPSTPLSYADASPILENLSGPVSPRAWQGALPFTYHVGPGPARVKMHLKQDYAYRTIWNVIGQVTGAQLSDEWVVAGNHRDAWVYGAVDPNSGTAAMLEAVHGIGELLKSGWKPRRRLVFASWDAEEYGLMGSTEWAEQHALELAKSPAYFNLDAAVCGPKFGASSSPALKQFLRDIAKSVPSPAGGTLYEVWRKATLTGATVDTRETASSGFRPPNAQVKADVPVGDLGSGSDYAVFLQHLGVPATDVGTTGDYGVYHSAFDNFAWFKKFGDPDFLYEQEMARFFGLEALRMADAEVLPYDMQEYAQEIAEYVKTASRKSLAQLGSAGPSFADVSHAAEGFMQAATGFHAEEQRSRADPQKLNRAMLTAEHAFLLDGGLPGRPWYRHAVYAPGEYTGYAAVVIPGVNQAIDRNDPEQLRQQLAALTEALARATSALQDVH